MDDGESSEEEDLQEEGSETDVQDSQESSENFDTCNSKHDLSADLLDEGGLLLDIYRGIPIDQGWELRIVGGGVRHA